MDVREHIIAGTARATDDFFRYCRAVPEDKVNWSPLDAGRSVLDMAAECALSPTWGTSLLEHREFKMSPEIMQQFMEAKAAITSIEQAEQVCRANCETFYAAVRAFPADELENTIQLPFGADPNWSFKQLMNIHLWNCTYHLGQVAYVQTLYGDKEMH